MKKLLLVLLVVTLASFLFVGCLPTTPAEGEGEGEGEGEICPTVAVTSQVAVAGKNYIKAGTQTITVTFAVPTEPVSVFIGEAIKGNPEGVPDEAKEVIMYPDADKKVYTGTFKFFGEQCEPTDCSEDYIYVLTCETCAPCKYPYTVDSVAPYATVEICIDKCTCAGCELSFTSTTSEVTCGDDTVNCGDACSGFASWSIDIYDDYPFDDCCLVPCEVPIASDSGVCPIDFTTACLGTPTSETLYVVVTLVDQVGNETKMGATITFNPDTCDSVTLTQWPDGDCVDTPDFVLCEDIVSALGNISGTVIDALTTSSIPGATVTILNTSIPLTTTDSSGDYSFSDVPVGDYDVEASATGYVDNTISLTVQENQTVTGDIVLTPTVASGEMRIVLTWGTTGDLDSHLLNPSSQHLYFGHMIIDDATLDVDNTYGYGPETVTITALNDGTYTYAVHDWGLEGGSTITTCDAVVKLYDSNGLVNTYTPPAVVSPSDAWWTAAPPGF
jgi:hypothetical protein